MSRLDPELLRIVRLDELLQNVADSEQIACMVIDEFLVHFELQLLEIGRGIERGDLPTLARAAHQLKGAVSAVSAASTTTIPAGALELAAMRGDLHEVRRAFAALAPHVVTLARTLRAWRAQFPARRAQ